jgi:hypothetical protein
MARSLVFDLNGTQISCNPEKVDRTKLYGFIDVEALDGKGRKCTLATLADDGRTIIGAGGSAFGSLSPDGEWLEKTALKPVDPEGKPIAPVPSTYGAPVPLAKTATIDEYLSHNIKGVYVLRAEGDLAKLETELRKGTIYTFPYSFRGGLEADVGFLLAAPDGSLFLAVGQPTKIHFVGLEQQATVDESEIAVEGEEEVDFGMM